MVAILCLLAPCAFAEAPSAADQRAQAVTQVVLGILSYARWPVEPTQLHLCIVGPTQYTDDLIKGTTQATGRPVEVRRLLADHPDIVNACDAVYIGKLSNDERSRLFTSPDRPPGAQHQRRRRPMHRGQFVLPASGR